MNYSIYRISLDIHDTASQVSLSVKRGDTGRKIIAVLTENGKPYKIADGVSAVFRAKKPADSNGNRAIVYNDTDIIDNAIHYTLVSDNTEVVGVADCEFTLYGHSGEELTSPRFTLIIYDTVNTDDEVESVGSNELKALAALHAQTNEALRKAESISKTIPDWNQQNPDAPDYIKNKPFVPQVNNEAISDDIWSSKTIVDKFCLPFTETGNAVTCHPVKGYPMEVVTDGTAITRCGKNMWDFKASVQRVTVITNKDGDQIEYWGHRLILPPGKYTLHADRVSGSTARYIYGDINGADGAHKGDVNIVVGSVTNTKTITITEGDVLYIYNGNTSSTETGSNNIFKEYNVQIEAGTAVTDYEAYRGGTFTATPSSTIVPALDGLNIIFANNGEVTVSGRIDPKHLYTMLTSSAAE